MDQEKNMQNEELDLFGILKRIKGMKRSLIKVGILGLIVGIIIAISIPRKYTTTVIISPEAQSNGKSSGLMGIASNLMGASIGEQSKNALNMNFAAEIVSSTPFMRDMLKSKIKTKETIKELSLSEYIDSMKNPWWIEVIRFPFMLFKNKNKTISNIENSTKNEPLFINKEEYEKLKVLRNCIIANIDKKTGIITINVSLQNAEVSAWVAQLVIEKLQNYLEHYNTAKLLDNYNFLKNAVKKKEEEYKEANKKLAAYVDANSRIFKEKAKLEKQTLQNDVNVKYDIYMQLEKELQSVETQIQENKPLFAVIEPPTVPIIPSAPNKKIIVVFSLIIFLGTYIIWSLNFKRK